MHQDKLRFYYIHEKFELELALGNALQPMYLDVNGEGNFVFRVKSIDKALPVNTISSNGLSSSDGNKTWNKFNEYYTDQRVFIRVIFASVICQLVARVSDRHVSKVC